MKARWYQKVGVVIAIMLCMCPTSMATESNLGPASTSEALRQRYVTGLTYHKADASYTPEAGDIIFYDIDQDGIADGNGIVCTMGDVAIVGWLAFDTPEAICGLREQLQDWVMGYGTNQEQADVLSIPIAPGFCFI